MCHRKRVRKFFSLLLPGWIFFSFFFPLRSFIYLILHFVVFNFCTHEPMTRWERRKRPITSHISLLFCRQNSLSLSHFISPDFRLSRRARIPVKRAKDDKDGVMRLWLCCIRWTMRKREKKISHPRRTRTEYLPVHTGIGGGGVLHINEAIGINKTIIQSSAGALFISTFSYWGLQTSCRESISYHFIVAPTIFYSKMVYTPCLRGMNMSRWIIY